MFGDICAQCKREIIKGEHYTILQDNGTKFGMRTFHKHCAPTEEELMPDKRLIYHASEYLRPHG